MGRRLVDCRGRCLGSQPQRGPGGLHGLVDHGQQLAGQGGQVDLVAQAGAEGWRWSGRRRGGVG